MRSAVLASAVTQIKTDIQMLGSQNQLTQLLTLLDETLFDRPLLSFDEAVEDTIEKIGDDSDLYDQLLGLVFRFGMEVDVDEMRKALQLVLEELAENPAFSSLSINIEKSLQVWLLVFRLYADMIVTQAVKDATSR